MSNSRLALVGTAWMLSSFCACSRVPDKSEPAPPAATAAAPTPAGGTFGKLSVAPPNGAAAEQVFTVTLERAPGTPLPLLVGLLIAGPSGTGNDACYAFSNIESRGAVLVNDSGSGSKPIGDTPWISNRQCDLLKDQTTSSVTGATVTARFHLRFHRGFTGSRKVYAIAQDANAVGDGLHPVGEFVVQ